ncbi:fluoride efflux transporter FluC [Arthrobacter alpinus]|uniref:fluoride efflux transporter FluC n=1 Tax=Arthrobacter alpinus TaxID=656366 RepID=UPI0005C82A1F|nr:CrcB family protein [Arthrobacter alpinus]
MKPHLLHSLALIGIGGSLGAAAREGLVLAIPDAGGIPWAIVLANVVGAFVLGLLLSSLARAASQNPPRPDVADTPALPRRRRLQLLLGTGFCGGFTTYSTLAVGMVSLSGTAVQGVGPAAVYGLGTVLVGGVATWVGMALGSRRIASEPPVHTISAGSQYGGRS